MVKTEITQSFGWNCYPLKKEKEKKKTRSGYGLYMMFAGKQLVFSYCRKAVTIASVQVCYVIKYLWKLFTTFPPLNIQVKNLYNFPIFSLLLLFSYVQVCNCCIQCLSFQKKSEWCLLNELSVWEHYNTAIPLFVLSPYCAVGVHSY